MMIHIPNRIMADEARERMGLTGAIYKYLEYVVYPSIRKAAENNMDAFSFYDCRDDHREELTRVLEREGYEIVHDGKEMRIKW